VAGPGESDAGGAGKGGHGGPAPAGGFEDTAHGVWNEAVAIQVDTAGEITRQLNLTLERIDALMAGQPSDWQQWYLPQLRKSVEHVLGEFGADAGQVMHDGAAASWDKGIELVDAPLATGGIQLDGMAPRLDRGQLLAMQHFLTSKMRDVSAAVANRVNQELGLVVTGISTPSQAATSIQGILGGAARKRALTIVRTELGRAFSTATQGRMEQAKKVGVAGLKKQWRRSGKIHSRRTHDLADGQIREVDEPFMVGGEKIMYPRDPKASAKNTVNCGCTQLPYMDHWQVTHKGEKPFTPDELAGSRAKRDIQQIRDGNLAPGAGLAGPAAPASLRSSASPGGGDGRQRDANWQSAPKPPLAPQDLALRAQVLGAATAEGAAGEHLAARNLVDGREWAALTSGERNKVEIPADLRAVLADPAAQVALHHDHPDATSFSATDLRLLDRYPGLQAVFAHGHDGTSYQAGRAAEAVSVAEAEKVARAAVAQELARAVSTGRLWSRESAEFRRHAVNAAMAKAGVINYIVHWSPGAEQRWNDVRAVIEDAIHAGSKALQGRNG